MKIHEYQAKQILKKFNVSLLQGEMTESVDEAYEIAKRLGSPVVVKAQIHAGGRGKGGGVKLAKSPEEARDYAKQILGMQLITHQTGPEGTKVKKIFLEQGCQIAKELYLGVVLDRASSRITVMASLEGGVEIEEVAEKHPEKILKVAIDPAVGFQAYQGRELAFGLQLKPELVSQFVKFVGALYNAYVSYDCSLAEINPLVITADNQIIALDAKMTFDDNALFRHKDLEEMRDPNEEDPNEILAKKYDLSYIALDGNIGCMVNGAGLAMATMDIIKLFGGEPANFLDVGGGATTEKVTAAFKIILSDPKVKAILVNIFGGIMKCDVIATGVVAAAKELGLKVPLVVRLLGTNVELGKKILADSGLPIISADRMDEAAEKIVATLKS